MNDLWCRFVQKPVRTSILPTTAIVGTRNAVNITITFPFGFVLCAREEVRTALETHHSHQEMLREEEEQLQQQQQQGGGDGGNGGTGDGDESDDGGGKLPAEQRQNGWRGT